MSTTTEFENNENNHLLLLVNYRVTTFCFSIRRNSKCIEKPLSLGEKIWQSIPGTESLKH